MAASRSSLVVQAVVDPARNKNFQCLAGLGETAEAGVRKVRGGLRSLIRHPNIG